MMNALLIDSDLDSLAVLERLLYLDGRLKAIHCCTEPDMAWPQVRRTQPDVIFLETRLFQNGIAADGIALAKRIRKSRPLVHLVFVSSDPGQAYAAFQAFPLAFVKKPVRQSALQTVLARLFLSSGPLAHTSLPLRLEQPKAYPLRCFGEYEIVDPNRPNRPIQMPNRFCRILLAYLINRHDRIVGRADLMSDLLPERSDERAVNLLHVQVYRLRRFLMQNRNVLNGLAVLDHYRLDIPGGVCDAVDFSRYIRQAPVLSAETIHDAEAIAALYRGPCFDGEDYPWADGLRSELEVGHEKLLLRIAEYRWHRHEQSLSEQALNALIKINPLSEAGHCTLLDQYLQCNERRKFLSQYEQYQRIMQEELDAPVDRQFQKAYLQMRQ